MNERMSMLLEKVFPFSAPFLQTGENLSGFI